jgi:uncharacterized protein (DUF433 family)
VSRPVIVTPVDHPPRLSFINMIEAHVLAVIRFHGIALPRVRRAVEWLTKHYGSRHPLAEQPFETDGVNLFVRQLGGHLIDVTAPGQLAMPEMLRAYLRRIERDDQGLAIRLYPFTRPHNAEAPRLVVIDPFLSFGRPVLVGHGVTTSTIKERWDAGDSFEVLADDYDLTIEEIEEALRCEFPVAA